MSKIIISIGSGTKELPSDLMSSITDLLSSKGFSVASHDLTSATLIDAYIDEPIKEPEVAPGTDDDNGPLQSHVMLAPEEPEVVPVDPAPVQPVQQDAPETEVPIDVPMGFCKFLSTLSPVNQDVPACKYFEGTDNVLFAKNVVTKDGKTKFEFGNATHSFYGDKIKLTVELVSESKSKIDSFLFTVKEDDGEERVIISC